MSDVCVGCVMRSRPISERYRPVCLDTALETYARPCAKIVKCEHWRDEIKPAKKAPRK